MAATRTKRAAREMFVAAAAVLEDTFRDVIESLAEDPDDNDLWMLDDVLPPSFAHYYDAAFLERFRELVPAVGDRLAAYPDTYLASTAEELLAHALVEGATEWVEVCLKSGEMDDVTAALVRRFIEQVDAEVFEDAYVLFLFDPAFDGIEDVTSGPGKDLGVANLHPRDWFKLFSES